ncbi:MAG: hypothetical protein ACYTX0_43020 [Nostoc sp.]
MISGQLSDPSIFQSSELAQFSKQLGQTVITLLVSDSAGEIGYDLFEGGELVEYFRGADGELTDDSNKYGIQSQLYLYRVLNPGFTLVLGYEEDGRSQEITSVPDLVRVDYFRFGN